MKGRLIEEEDHDFHKGMFDGDGGPVYEIRTRLICVEFKGTRIHFTEVRSQHVGFSRVGGRFSKPRKTTVEVDKVTICDGSCNSDLVELSKEAKVALAQFVGEENESKES